MENTEEQGRVPRARAGRLVGASAAFAGLLNLFIILGWMQSSESASLRLALWATGFELISSTILLISAGVLRDFEGALNFATKVSVADKVEIERRLEKRLEQHRELYYGCISCIIIGLSATVILTGGPIHSPIGQVLLGAFILGQILSPNTGNVWTLFVIALFTMLACQVLYALLETYWLNQSLSGLDAPVWTYFGPIVLTAVASTFINLASVRSRQTPEGGPIS